MESMKIWSERIRKALRKLSDGVDDGLDQIDTSGHGSSEMELMKGWIERVLSGS
jgi:hypothetical protein